MKDFYEVSVKEDHVLLVSEVPASPEGAREFYETAPARVRATGHDKVLIDIRKLDRELTTTDSYFYAVGFAEAFRGLKVAVVQSPTMYDPKGFPEMVAANRGLDSRNFTSMDEALAWLRADDRAAGREEGGS